MGNCCSSEGNKDQAATLADPKPRSVKFTSNEGGLDLQTRNAHAPSEGVAQQVSEMNRLHPRVEEVEKKSQPFAFDKYDKAEYASLPKLGVYKYENGATYTGQYSNGNRHGKGRQVWTDGSVYDGFWENDKSNGYGRLIHIEGDVY